MITPEINDIVNKFGELVERIAETSGHPEVCGNQVMFSRDPESGKTIVLGVCFMLPHSSRGVIYYRTTVEGLVAVLAPSSTDNNPVIVENVAEQLGEDYAKVEEYLKVISRHLILSTFANFIIEKQEIVLAVQAAATALNNALDEEFKVESASAESTETPLESSTEVKEKKPKKSRKSKKTIEISKDTE